jgi:hypothetical protein
MNFNESLSTFSWFLKKFKKHKFLIEKARAKNPINSGNSNCYPDVVNLFYLFWTKYEPANCYHPIPITGEEGDHYTAK